MLPGHLFLVSAPPSSQNIHHLLFSPTASIVGEVERLTFQLLHNERDPGTALVSCDGTEELTEVSDNHDGSKSILVIPGTQCEVTLEI